MHHYCVSQAQNSVEVSRKCQGVAKVLKFSGFIQSPRGVTCDKENRPIVCGG